MKKLLPYFIVICIILLAFVIFMPHHDKETKTGKILQADSEPIKKRTPMVDIFIENSGSMDGYMNGNTEFKDALGNLIVKITNLYSGSELNFINNDIYPIKITDGIGEFIKNLNPATMKVGNTKATNINEIFSKILSKTRKDTVSILFSDCVYSIPGKDVRSELASAKNATMDAVLRALKENPDLSAIIIKCTSEFDGTYYDRNDAPIPYKGYRPYYIFILGSYDLLNDLNTRLDITSITSGIKGIKNMLMLSTQSWSLDENTARIITSEYTNAERIKPSPNGLDIADFKTSRETDKVRFAVGLGVSHLFVDKSYLLDKANYEVDPQCYTITDIEPVDKNSVAYSDCSDFTHPVALKLSTQRRNMAPQVCVRMKLRIPDWVKQSGDDDDSGRVPPQDKTFAIDDMIEGFYNAFYSSLNADNKYIFELKFNIKDYE